MNGSYYKSPLFTGDSNYERDTSFPGNTVDLPMEQSYIENILRFNKGKRVTAYFSFSDSNNHKDMVYKGIIEQAGRDHLILSDPQTGKWYLLLMIYLDYIEFDEKINYQL